jgi:heptosyltransferase-2
MKPVTSILIVKFAALGDVLRTSYILPGLQAKWPQARLWWLTADQAGDLLRYNPYVFRVCTPRCGFDALKAEQFDQLICLDEEPEILRRVAELRARQTIGARLVNGRPRYCSKSAPWFNMGLISRLGKAKADELKRTNRLEHHRFLERMLGIRIAGPSFFNSGVLERRARMRFDQRCFNLGLASGAGGRWPAKQLPLAQTVELVKRLLRASVAGKPVRVYLLGGPAETERHRALRQTLSQANLIDAGSAWGLLEFAALVKCCDYVISSDSLALHLAIAQNVSNLSFYAPTSAAEIGTFGSGVKVVSSAEDYCCYRPDADSSTITAARILAAFARHLRRLRLECAFNS